MPIRMLLCIGIGSESSVLGSLWTLVFGFFLSIVHFGKGGPGNVNLFFFCVNLCFAALPFLKAVGGICPDGKVGIRDARMP